jgi:hypothetical protein
MSVPTESVTASGVGRRVGYAVGAVVNVALLVALNVWPGWDAVPFLTADFEQVLGLVNLSLAVGFLTSVANLALDSFGAKALGDLATNVIGFAVSIRMLQVFPFDFSGGFDWTLIVRILLVLGVVGSFFGALAAVVRLLRGPRPEAPPAG